jgi:DNA-binding transcriptional regulator YiaG
VSSAEPSRKPDPGERQPPTSTTDAAHLTGADLATWRKRLGLTQQAAADRLGVRQGTISKAESRARKPLGPTLHQALAVEMVSK